MITATHMLIYSEDENATRDFFRDVLGLPNVDAHEGWLIFKTGPSELGIHPTDGTASPVRHEMTFMCDDLDTTVADLAAKGVEFVDGPHNRGWGVTMTMKVPGAGTMLLYQPRHPTAFDLER